MKATGESFSFIQKEKKSRRGKIVNVSKFSGKKDCYRTELWRASVIIGWLPFETRT
jgi:hypothetical protein